MDKIYQYIDLFDDDLYDPEEYIKNNSSYSELVNTIRLQVLISILFNKQIVVPEQWATSSSSFMHVADEVIRGYQNEVSLRVSRSEIKRKRIPPPFVIAFHKQNEFNQDFYANSIISRIDSGSRIRICSSTHDKNSNSYSISRERLRNIYVEQDNIHDLESKYGDKFVDELARCIGCDETAIRMQTLAKYLLNSRNTFFEFFPSNYRQDLASYTGNVKRVCFEDQVVASYNDERIEEFKEFFLKAAEKNIGLSQLNQLWEESKSFSEKSFNLITKMGRYCMHRALAVNIKASYSSTFYGSFGSNGRDSFDEFIIDRMRKLEINLTKPNKIERDFSFIANENTQNYDLGDRVYWPEVWGQVGAFSVSNEWQQLLKELREELNEMPLEKVHEAKTWRGIFDRINGKITDFTFKQSKSNPTSVEVIMNRAGDTQTASKGLSVVEPTIFAPFGMLAALAKASVKYVPFKYELKLTRAYRKAKQIFSKEN